MTYEMIKNTREYWLFIRDVRFHPKNLYGYVHNDFISDEQQIAYMEKHCNEYWVCRLGATPVGFVGIVDNDLRIGVHPDYQRKGVGTLMMQHILNYHEGDFTVRIKLTNEVGLAFFKTLGYKPEFYVMGEVRKNDL